MCPRRMTVSKTAARNLPQPRDAAKLCDLRSSLCECNGCTSNCPAVHRQNIADARGETEYFVTHPSELRSSAAFDDELRDITRQPAGVSCAASGDTQIEFYNDAGVLFRPCSRGALSRADDETTLQD